MNAAGELLLRDTLEHVTAHRDELDQSEWAWKTACGTTMCLGGHAVVRAGHQIQWNVWSFAAGCVTSGRSISEVAREVLDLTEDQADRLFAAGNSLVDLWRLASEFTDGRIQVPAGLSDEVYG